MSDTTKAAPKQTIETALLSVQAELRTIGLDANNPHFKSRYSSWPKIWGALQPILSQHGVLLSQGFTSDLGKWSICALHVESATTRVWYLPVPEWTDSRNPAQALGSLCSYLTRYGARVAFQLATGEDEDDGNALGKADKPATVTAAQWKRLSGAAKQAGKVDELRAMLGIQYGVERGSDLPASAFDAVLAKLEGRPAKPASLADLTPAPKATPEVPPKATDF